MENSIKLQHYTRLSNRQFAGQTSAYIKHGHKEREKFENYCFNAVLRTFETNDVSHVNNALKASESVGRKRTAMRVLPGLVAFPFDRSAQIFHGKRQAGTYNKLAGTNEDTGMSKIEELCIQYFQQENVFSKQTPASDWSLETAMLNLVKKANKKEMTIKDLDAAFEKAKKEALEAA